jgi:hypothetical protein
MLSVVMLPVVMMSVVVPFEFHCCDFHPNDIINVKITLSQMIVLWTTLVQTKDTLSGATTLTIMTLSIMTLDKGLIFNTPYTTVSINDTT